MNIDIWLGSIVLCIVLFVVYVFEGAIENEYTNENCVKNGYSGGGMSFRHEKYCKLPKREIEIIQTVPYKDAVK
jgi:hypothetical protein